MKTQDFIEAKRKEFWQKLNELDEKLNTANSIRSIDTIIQAKEALLETYTTELVAKVREEERERILNIARNNSCSAYFVHQGADYVLLDTLKETLTKHT